jgi:hypothetical protein
MDTLKPKESRESAQQRTKQHLEQPEKAEWERPTMEDVSEQVMAQPYIRFT